MISTNLYETALIQPYKDGADKLQIISGYATSAMAFHHLEDIKNLGNDLTISLIVGMCPSDGLSLSNHRGFQSIMSSDYSNNFSCSYLFNMPQVHSKLYIWYKNDALYKSFIGSANYTQNAFSLRQREILSEVTDENISDYYKLIEKDSIYCNNMDAEGLVRIYNDKNYYKKHKHEERDIINLEDIPDGNNFEEANASLLDKHEEVHKRGGLNWGQRPGRDPNQAYIQLSPDVYKSDFFPKKPQHFTVVTDDSKTLICTRAQKSAEGHAIETPHNNSLIGEYFRNRLGLRNGEFVTKEHLENYGRTDVKFYKFDNENYYMDFSITG